MENNLAQIVQYYEPSFEDGRLSLVMRAAEYTNFVRLITQTSTNGVYFDRSLVRITRKPSDEYATIHIDSAPKIIGLIRMGLDFIGMTEFMSMHGPHVQYLNREVKLREVRLAERKLIEHLQGATPFIKSDELILEDASEEEARMVENLAMYAGVKCDSDKCDESWKNDGDITYDLTFTYSDIDRIRDRLKRQNTSWVAKAVRGERPEKELHFEQEVGGFINFLKEMDFYKEPFKHNIRAQLPESTDIPALLAAKDELELEGLNIYQIGENNCLEIDGEEELMLLAALGLDFEYKEGGKTQSFAARYQYLSVMTR